MSATPPSRGEKSAPSWIQYFEGAAGRFTDCGIWSACSAVTGAMVFSSAVMRLMQVLRVFDMDLNAGGLAIRAAALRGPRRNTDRGDAPQPATFPASMHPRLHRWLVKLRVHKWSMHVIEEKIMQKRIFCAWNLEDRASSLRWVSVTIHFLRITTMGGGGALFKGVLLGMNLE